MDELYMYYTVLYRKISGLRRRYNTNYIVMTNYSTGLLNQTVSYRSISYSDPALLAADPLRNSTELEVIPMWDFLSGLRRTG